MATLEPVTGAMNGRDAIKALDRNIKAINSQSVATVNNLTTTTPGSALDATQGKILKDQQDEIKSSLLYKEKQTDLYAKFYQKLRTGITTSIACVGDSTTYGEDKTSADIRPCPTNLTDNGVAYNSYDTRASVTYPESLQEALNEIYGTDKVSVINKGYSGDDVSEAYEHWNVNTDIALISLGINDAINSTYAGNLETFLSWYRKLIEKHLDNNCAVIIMTPTKLRQDVSTDISVFRHSLYLLAEEYNIPIIDGFEMLNNVDYSYYSDATHLTGVGYKYLGKRIASIFIGEGVAKPKTVLSGDTLIYRTSSDNIINKGCALSGGNADSGTPEGLSNTGVGLTVNDLTDTIYYSVYTGQENLVVVPIIYGLTGAVAKIEVDFSEQMPQPTNDFSLYATTVDRTYPISNISYTWAGNYTIPKDDILFKNPMLYITTKGWHTIKITKTSTANVSFQGINFVSLESTKFMNKTNLSYLTHTTYTDTTTVASKSFDIFYIAKRLQALNSENMNDYWKQSPIKIKVHIYDQSVVEYMLQIGNNDASGITWRIKEINRVEFVTTPQVRTIDSVTYNNTTKLLTLNFGGTTNKVAEISFSN